MTQFLPPNLLALFAPRDPIKHLPPIEKPNHYRKLPYTGVAQFLSEFENPKQTPLPTRVETKEERKERRRKEKAEQIAYKLEQDLAMWNPQGNPNATGDPYKTLFVARVNYDTSESKLRREFDTYGPIRKICVVYDQRKGGPRGYAFIEYEHERDMHAAYKHADGKKIDGRRVLVDVERARTVRNWRPRRLAGGLGSTRRGPPELNAQYSGRDDNAGRAGSHEKDRRSNRRSRSPIRERRPDPGFRRGTGSSFPDDDRRSSRRRPNEDNDVEGSRSRDRGRVAPNGAAVSSNPPPVARSEDRRRGRSRSRERRRSRSRDRRRRDDEGVSGAVAGEFEDY